MSQIRYATPQDAEAAFYDAFTRNDLDAMMNVWADDEDIYCVHPHGARCSGVAQVLESWRQIFSAGSTLRFQLRAQQTMQAMMVAVHSVYEQITVAGDNRPPATTIATNVYLRTDRGWRMVAHHASPVAAKAEPAAAAAPPKTLH